VDHYGTTIRKLRKAKGWKQQQLAEEAGVDKETVVRAEKGESVSTGKLAQIAAALGTDLSALFGAVTVDVPTDDALLLARLTKNELAIVRRMIRSFLKSRGVILG
jgi:transcriptional regulator with XRE-family HTH domain